jgi:hypothetical protein
MKPEDTANLIAIISAAISVISVGVAGAAFRSSRKSASEQTALQARLTAIEEERREEERERRRRDEEAGRRAQLDAHIAPRSETRPEAWVLTVLSHGPAEARHVDFDLEALDGGDAPLVLRRAKLEHEGSLPVRSLAPGHERRYDIMLKNYSGVRVLLRWKDDAGAREQKFELQTRTMLPT